jgi:hypothetical protein
MSVPDEIDAGGAGAATAAAELVRLAKQEARLDPGLSIWYAWRHERFIRLASDSGKPCGSIHVLWCALGAIGRARETSSTRSWWLSTIAISDDPACPRRRPPGADALPCAAPRPHRDAPGDRFDYLRCDTVASGPENRSQASRHLLARAARSWSERSSITTTPSPKSSERSAMRAPVVAVSGWAFAAQGAIAWCGLACRGVLLPKSHDEGPRQLATAVKGWSCRPSSGCRCARHWD